VSDKTGGSAAAVLVIVGRSSPMNPLALYAAAFPLATFPTGGLRFGGGAGNCNTGSSPQTTAEVRNMEATTIVLGFICMGAIVAGKWDLFVYKVNFVLEGKFGKVFWEAS